MIHRKTILCASSKQWYKHKSLCISVFKTAHRKYISVKTLRCLSLPAKGQHWNFVSYFFHSLSSILFLNPLSLLSLKNTIMFFVEYLHRMRNILHFSIQCSNHCFSSETGLIKRNHTTSLSCSTCLEAAPPSPVEKFGLGALWQIG